MKVLDRYILKAFLGVFAGSLLSVTFLFTALGILDSLTYLMSKKGASFGEIVYYYLLQLPQTIYMTAPVAALLSAMITLGALNQRHEIEAIRAGGVSVARTGLPVLLASLLVALALFVLGNSLVPYGNRYFLSAKQEMSGDDDEDEPRIWYVSERKDRPPLVLRIDRVDRGTGKIYGLTALSTGPGFALDEQMIASSAEYREGRGWRLEDVRRRKFNGQEPPSLASAEEVWLDIPDTKEDMLRVQRSPEEMTLIQLKDQIGRVHNYGLPDEALRVELQSRFAIPLATIILVLTGAPLAIRPVRSTGLAVSIVGAIMVGFAYYVIMAEFISLGKGGLVSPAMAAWSANVIFGGVGVALYSGLRK